MQKFIGKLPMRLALIIGFLIILLGSLMLKQVIFEDMGPIVARLVWVIGVGIWTFGCMLYAMNKGQNIWIGLAGLTIVLESPYVVIGLVVLLLLPTKNKPVEAPLVNPQS